MNTILQKRIEEAAENHEQCYNVGEEHGYLYTHKGDIKEAVIYGADFALQNQWISVEEECPIGTCVLLDKYGNMQLDRFDFRAWGYIQNKEITHWMPIPEVKGGEE